MLLFDHAFLNLAGPETTSEQTAHLIAAQDWLGSSADVDRSLCLYDDTPCKGKQNERQFSFL